VIIEHSIGRVERDIIWLDQNHDAHPPPDLPAAPPLTQDEIDAAFPHGYNDPGPPVLAFDDNFDPAIHHTPAGIQPGNQAEGGQDEEKREGATRRGILSNFP
jgi:hypothetical protein